MYNIKDLYRIIRTNTKSLTVMWNDFYNNRLKVGSNRDDQILIRDSEDDLKFRYSTISSISTSIGETYWDDIFEKPTEFNPTTYTNSEAMPEQIHGIAQGSTFDDVSLSDMFDNILYPYQSPAFTSFTMSSQLTTLECGIDVTGGNRTFTWANTNDDNIETDSLVIRDETNSTDLETSITDDNSEIVPIGSNITKLTTGDAHVWKILGTNSQSAEFTRNYSITWYSPFYYGSGSAGLNANSIQALTKTVVVKGTKTYTFNPTSQVMYFAYPKSYGLLSVILDPNSFNVTSDWIPSTVSFIYNPTDYNGSTMDYYVYEFANLVTLSNYEYTFYF